MAAVTICSINVCKFLFHVFWGSLIRHKQLWLLCLPNELHCYHFEVLLFSSSNHFCFSISSPWYQYYCFGFLIFIAYFLSSWFNFCPFLILCLHFCCFHLTSLQICLPHNIFSFVAFVHYLLLWVSCLSSFIYSTNNITIAIDATAATTTYLALLIPLIQHLLCAKLCPKCLTCVNSFNLLSTCYLPDSLHLGMSLCEAWGNLSLLLTT